MAAEAGEAGTDLRAEMAAADGALAPDARPKNAERAPPALYAVLATGHDLFTPAMMAKKVWITGSWELVSLLMAGRRGPMGISGFYKLPALEPESVLSSQAICDAFRSPGSVAFTRWIWAWNK